MKKIILLLVLSLAGLVHAGTPTTSVAHVEAIGDTPKTVPNSLMLNNGHSGIRITFLVSGENLASIKKGSLKIQSVGADKAVKLPAKLSSKITFNDFFAKVSEDGRFAAFTAEVPVDDAPAALTSFKLKGTVTVVTGIGENTLTGNLAASAKEIDVGGLTVSRSQGGGGFFGGGGDELALTFTGKSASVKSIEVLTSAGKELKSNSSMTMNGVVTRNYPAKKDTAVTVRITSWKSIKETDVPVSYGF